MVKSSVPEDYGNGGAIQRLNGAVKICRAFAACPQNRGKARHIFNNHSFFKDMDGLGVRISLSVLVIWMRWTKFRFVLSRHSSNTGTAARACDGKCLPKITAARRRTSLFE